MKASFKFLTSFAGALSLALGVGLPSFAQLNPNPTIFQEPPYAPVQRNYTTEILIPASDEPMTISEILRMSNSFTMLNALLPVADIDQRVGMVSLLNGNGNYTVFAPTDRAFADLPAGVVKALVQPENRDLLLEILSYHVVPNKAYSSTELQAGEIETQGGDKVTIQASSTAPGTVMVNEASVVRPDIKASNGVIHVIDRVILPTNLQARVNALALGPSAIERYRLSSPSGNTVPRTSNSAPINQQPSVRPSVPGSSSGGGSGGGDDLNEPGRIPAGVDSTPGRGNIFTPGSADQERDSIPANQRPNARPDTPTPRSSSGSGSGGMSPSYNTPAGPYDMGPRYDAPGANPNAPINNTAPGAPIQNERQRIDSAPGSPVTPQDAAPLDSTRDR